MVKVGLGLGKLRSVLAPKLLVWFTYKKDTVRYRQTTGARFMHYNNFVRFRHILELSKFRNTRV